MTQQRIPLIVQLSAAQASAGPFDLDYRFAPDQIRSIAGSVTGSDALKVLVSPVPATDLKVTYGGVQTSIGAHTGFFVTVSSYTGVFSDILNGPWARVKIEKTGTSGAATFYFLG